MTDMATSKKTLDVIRATIYGNCIGDAIGLLTEFLNKKQAHAYYGKYGGKLEYELKDLVQDRHRGAWEVGDWTDDSDQMILIMQSLIANQGQVDPVDFGRRLKYWIHHGFPELNDVGGNGIGDTTYKVISSPLFDTCPSEASHDIWERSGCRIAPNGAVMRTSVLGAYQYRDIDSVIRNSIAIATVTHADPRCQASCVATTSAIAMMLQERPKTSEQLEDIIEKSYAYAQKVLDDLQFDCKPGELRAHMFAKDLRDLKLDEPQKIGYTYKTLGAGFWALRQRDFRKAMEAIVMEAGDADTNGAVAGALLGCKLGLKGLPKNWVKNLLHKQWLDNIIDDFLHLVQPDESSGSHKGQITPVKVQETEQDPSDVASHKGQITPVKDQENEQDPSDVASGSCSHKGQITPVKVEENEQDPSDVASGSVARDQQKARSETDQNDGSVETERATQKNKKNSSCEIL